MVRRLRVAQHGSVEEDHLSILQRSTYDKNADLPTSPSPTRSMGTTGASMAALAMVVVLEELELGVCLMLK
jgi:hypothetical protein